MTKLFHARSLQEIEPYQAALNEMSKNHADTDKALAWLNQAVAEENANATYALGT